MFTPTADSAWRGIAKSLSLTRALAAALIVVALCGCDRPQPPLPVALPKGDSPEAKLERVIERLKFALTSAESAGDYGVVSKRECKYRLIQPSDKELRHTAEVTVRTTVALSDAAQPVDDDAATGEPKKTPPPKREQEMISLVYQNDRWEMPKEPESETLQICFESALRDE